MSSVARVAWVQWQGWHGFSGHTLECVLVAPWKDHLLHCPSSAQIAEYALCPSIFRPLESFAVMPSQTQG